MPSTPLAPSACNTRHGRFSGSCRITLLLLGALAIGLTSCKSTPEAPEQPPPKLPSSLAPHDEPTKEIPADFLTDMPIYPGARVEHVRKAKGSMREVVFSVKATLQELLDFYKPRLDTNGFRTTSSLIMAARRTWSSDFNKDGRTASIMLYPSDKDKSRMTIDLLYELPRRVDASLQVPREDFDVVGPGPPPAGNSSPNRQTKRN